MLRFDYFLELIHCDVRQSYRHSSVPIVAYMSVHTATKCPNQRYEIRPYGPVPKIAYRYAILHSLHKRGIVVEIPGSRSCSRSRSVIYTDSRRVHVRHHLGKSQI